MDINSLVGNLQARYFVPCQLGDAMYRLAQTESLETVEEKAMQFIALLEEKDPWLENPDDAAMMESLLVKAGF